VDTCHLPGNQLNHLHANAHEQRWVGVATSRDGGQFAAHCLFFYINATHQSEQQRESTLQL
jgi:hypothetical protein